MTNQQIAFYQLLRDLRNQISQELFGKEYYITTAAQREAIDPVAYNRAISPIELKYTEGNQFLSVSITN